MLLYCSMQMCLSLWTRFILLSEHETFINSSYSMMSAFTMVLKLVLRAWNIVYHSTRKYTRKCRPSNTCHAYDCMSDYQMSRLECIITATTESLRWA